MYRILHVLTGSYVACHYIDYQKEINIIELSKRGSLYSQIGINNFNRYFSIYEDRNYISNEKFSASLMEFEPVEYIQHD